MLYFSFTLFRDLNFIPREFLFLYEKQLGFLSFLKDIYSTFFNFTPLELRII